MVQTRAQRRLVDGLLTVHEEIPERRQGRCRCRKGQHHGVTDGLDDLTPVGDGFTGVTEEDHGHLGRLLIAMPVGEGGEAGEVHEADGAILTFHRTVLPHGVVKSPSGNGWPTSGSRVFRWSRATTARSLRS